MSDFAASNTKASKYTEIWADVGLPEKQSDAPPPNFGKPFQVTDFNPTEVYTSAIEKVVKQWSGNGYQGLVEVNTQDTSSYDPCAGDSLLEEILPVLLGAAGVVVVRLYGAEIFAFLSPQSKGYLEVTLFSTLFFVGKGLVDEAKLFEDGGESTKDDIENAASVLAIGSGITLSGTVSGMAQFASINPLYVTLGMGLLGNLLQPLFVMPIGVLVTSTGLLTALPLMMIRYINKLFCWSATAGQSACDDFGENAGGTSAGFPDARRWDVASLSARLADAAIESEGISRDSEQGRFIMRGLMTNPSWMTAATRNGVRSIYDADSTSWKGGTRVNPIGLIVPVVESGGTQVASGTDLNADAWSQYYEVDEFSFTGDTLESGYDPVTTSNTFACQNFDLMLNANRCYDPNNPTLHPNGPKCAANQLDNFEETVLATNMNDWIAALTESSYNPVNWYTQFQIPGLSTTYPTPPDALPDVKEFLWYADRDRTNTAGLGFDTVQERGIFASYYTKASVGTEKPLAQGVELSECVANTLFSLYPNMEVAWGYVTKYWTEQDQIALVHLWFGEQALVRGDRQRDSFDAWRDGFEAAKRFFDEHPIKESFSATLGFEKGSLSDLQWHPIDLDPNLPITIDPPLPHGLLPTPIAIDPPLPHLLGPRGLRPIPPWQSSVLLFFDHIQHGLQLIQNEQFEAAAAATTSADVAQALSYGTLNDTYEGQSLTYWIVLMLLMQSYASPDDYATAFEQYVSNDVPNLPAAKTAAKSLIFDEKTIAPLFESVPADQQQAVIDWINS